MFDFTVEIFKELMTTLLDKGYQIIPFNEYFKDPGEKFVILRHDVDARNMNSLRFATIQSELGIRGTYYFRTVPGSFDAEVIRKIASMGHEIGYHYETLSTCNGNIEEAYRTFCENLEKFRELYPVTTICMHGSPKSRMDSKDIWKKYDYRKLGIIGEPYFDIDFNEVFYLTDTGRQWDGFNVSIRDKIPDHQDRWIQNGLVFHTTREIISAAGTNQLPPRIMITFHPQRWHSKPSPWFKELVMQKAKNRIKLYLIKYHSV